MLTAEEYLGEITPRRFDRSGKLLRTLKFVLPAKGEWTDRDFLSACTFTDPDEVGSELELCEGHPEWMDDKLGANFDEHFVISASLVAELDAFNRQLKPRLGYIGYGEPVKIYEGTIRRPDVFLTSKPPKKNWELFLQADLVMEVLGRTKRSRDRDLIKKKAEYEKGKIKEYWIVDPLKACITVLKLEGKKGKFKVHGKFKKGQRATSVLFKDFSVDVTEALRVN